MTEKSNGYLFLYGIYIDLALFSVLFLFPCIVGADDDNGFNIFNLEIQEIMNIAIQVNVASHFLENDLDIPATVSSIESCQWQQTGARKLNDALDNEINVVNFRNIGGATILSIRGYTSSAGMRGVSWLIDGIPLNTLTYSTAGYSVPDWSLYTLDKIEMIKGPGSALYGSDAFHGVVSLKTFESDKDTYVTDIRGGFPDYRDAGFKFSKGINEHVRVDLATGMGHQGALDIDYDYEDTVGSMDRYGLPPKNGSGTREYKYDTYTGTAKLKIQPSEKFFITIGSYGSYCDADNHPLTRTVYMHMRDKDLLSNLSKIFMGQIESSYRFGNDISIEGKVYAWQTKYISFVDYPEEEYTSAATVGNPAFAIISSEDTQNERRTGVELLFKQPDNRFHLQWAIGCGFTKMEIYETYSKLKLYPSATWVPSYFQTTSDGTWPFDGLSREIGSLFISTKWETVKNKFFIISGARYDHYSDFGDQFTPRVGIIFKPDKTSAFKVLYSQAFRAAIASELTSVSVAIKGSKDIRPEVIDVYELIYMIQKKDWQFTMNGFYSKWTDGIINVPNPDFMSEATPGTPESFASIYTNEGESQSYGFEVETVKNIESFQINLGGAYTKSEAINATNPMDTTQTMDHEYDVFPRLSIKGGLLYHWKKKKFKCHINNILYMGMKAYPSSYKTDERHPQDLDPYWRVDLNMNKAISSKLNVTANVRNLFNRENHMPSVWGMKDGLEEPGTSFLTGLEYIF